jgi:putative endonuclease
MDCFVYIVRCSNETFYTGITWNLQKRVTEHNQGLRTFIKPSMRPVRLVYWEKFDSRVKAAGREKEIKGFSRKKKQLLIDSLR